MDEKTKAQKEQKKDRRRKFTSQMWTIILGTTISLIVTIVAAQILERNRRAKDRRLSAMMVMSNIERGQRPSPLCHDGNEQHRKLCTDT